MAQGTTEILIQFWIFAASLLKRSCIYLVDPTVDERNPPVVGRENPVHCAAGYPLMMRCPWWHQSTSKMTCQFFNVCFDQPWGKIVCSLAQEAVSDTWGTHEATRLSTNSWNLNISPLKRKSFSKSPVLSTMLIFWRYELARSRWTPFCWAEFVLRAYLTTGLKRLDRPPSALDNGLGW